MEKRMLENEIRKGSDTKDPISNPDQNQENNLLMDKQREHEVDNVEDIKEKPIDKEDNFIDEENPYHVATNHIGKNLW